MLYKEIFILLFLNAYALGNIIKRKFVEYDPERVLQQAHIIDELLVNCHHYLEDSFNIGIEEAKCVACLGKHTYVKMYSLHRLMNARLPELTWDDRHHDWHPIRPSLSKDLDESKIHFNYLLEDYEDPVETKQNSVNAAKPLLEMYRKSLDFVKHYENNEKDWKCTKFLCDTIVPDGPW